MKKIGIKEEPLKNPKRVMPGVEPAPPLFVPQKAPVEAPIPVSIPAREPVSVPASTPDRQKQWQSQA